MLARSRGVLRLSALARWLATLPVMAACTEVDGFDVASVDGRDDLELQIHRTEIRNGLSPEIAVPVPAGAHSVLFEVRGTRGNYYLSKLATPRGVDLVESSAIKTSFAREVPGAVNWLYPNDPDQVLSGGKHAVLIRAEDPDGAHVAAEDVELRVYVATPPAHPQCGLHLDFLVDSAAIDPRDAEYAVDELVARARDLYAQVGVDVIDYSYYRTTLLAPDVSYGPSGQDATAAVSNVLEDARANGSARDGSIHVMVVRSIDGFDNKAGYSMALPGPYGADRPNAAVLVSTNAYTGSDGYLDLDGLGVTLAHEIGHYLGLYHTSEQSGTSHDPIADTPECGMRPCALEFENNLMSPGGDPGRSVLTAGQGVVIRRHPLCAPVEPDLDPPEPSGCSLLCDVPRVCTRRGGIETCDLACDPDSPTSCGADSACAPDDLGTYTCVSL